MEAKQITSPATGTIVTHTGWRFEEDKNYPCDVYIESGCYLDSTFGRVSNYWTWRRVLEDGSLSESQSGYGSFVETEKEYKISIKIDTV